MIRRACLGFAIAALLAACGDDSSAGDSLLSAREACSFDAGALPADTLGKNIPRGDAIPIDHFVLLMQENRSFDHYFGRLPAAGHSDVDGLPDDAGNPDADGNSVPAFHAGEYCIRDVEHSWNDSHRQYNDGYGFRVPLLVASPHARPGHVSHLTNDLTSVLRLLEARWNLPALTARDANATPITDLFDFSRPRLLDPPPLPKATLDPVQAQLCAAFAE